MLQLTSYPKTCSSSIYYIKPDCRHYWHLLSKNLKQKYNYDTTKWILLEAINYQTIIIPFQIKYKLAHAMTAVKKIFLFFCSGLTAKRAIPMKPAKCIVWIIRCVVVGYHNTKAHEMALLQNIWRTSLAHLALINWIWIKKISVLHKSFQILSWVNIYHLDLHYCLFFFQISVLVRLKYLAQASYDLIYGLIVSNPTCVWGRRCKV